MDMLPLLNDLGAWFGLAAALATAYQFFRDGQKAKALEVAKDVMAQVTLDVAEDERIEQGVAVVYDVLAAGLMAIVRNPKLATLLITKVVPKKVVVEVVQKAWHLYVKPRLEQEAKDLPNDLKH